MAIERALLLIADIAGYTRFMKVHQINLSHAQYVVAQLLEAVIDGGGSKLKLAKLEGDAAFFYAVLPKEDSMELTGLSRQVADIRRSFLSRRNELQVDRVCDCDGCVQAGDLKLKFVAHVGDVAFQRVKSFTELAGVDVILVHRMLKNSVPVPEYVLMSEKIQGSLPEDIRPHAREIDEDLEGLGAVRMHYIDLEAIAQNLPKTLERSFFRRMWKWLRLFFYSVPYMLHLREPCLGFRNLETIGLPAPEAETK